MLFNSYLFLFSFLPITLAGAYFLMRFWGLAVVPWLLMASLTFYSWWNPHYLLLLIASIIFNFLTAKYILYANQSFQKKVGLIIGVLGNISVLAYYKYTNFFLHNINQAIHTNFNYYNIILPLGISFFTFTQMAFLIDSYQGKVSRIKFLDFSLFVTYFPHLIAGPIIHHSDVMPQFEKLKNHLRLPVFRYFIIGLTIFTIGLFKKVCIADMLAPKVDYIFQIPGKGYELSMLDAWIGAVGYTLQLYFDFSGYSDMAIGLSYMIGIRLPVNFYSPYKAINMIDFWRRWHMTLSRFFRDYLYIPLGGNRRGPVRRYVNLFLVMVIVGFWHGAGWTFILWGAYHGVLLVLNHGWNAVKAQLPLALKGLYKIKLINLTFTIASRFSTFCLVVIGWVLFRASDFATAKNFYAGMFHFHRYYYGSCSLLTILNYVFFSMFLLASLFIAFVMPNNIQLMKSTNAALKLKSFHRVNKDGVIAFDGLAWAPRLGYAILIGMLAYFSLAGIANTQSNFLYFNF